MIAQAWADGALARVVKETTTPQAFDTAKRGPEKVPDDGDQEIKDKAA